MPKRLHYSTFGPFHLDRDEDDVSSDMLRHFWDQLEGTHPKLQDAVGIYIFSVRKNGKGNPWYVGQTSKLSFQKRLTQHRLRFHDVLRKAGRDGELEIFLLAAKVPGSDRYRKPTTTSIQQNLWLESQMIGAALRVNKALVNANGKISHQMEVPGFLNTSRESESSSAGALRSLFAGSS